MGQDDREPQKDTSGKCPLFCYVLILYLPIILLVVVTPFSIDVKICLAVFLCIRSIAFYFFAYDCSKKDKLPYKISWLVGLSLLFILIIVLGLFANTFSGFSVIVPSYGNFNGSTITLTSVLLFILSIFISILSGNVVYQKGKENRQKQQDMTGKIEKLDNDLKQIYGEGKSNG